MVKWLAVGFLLFTTPTYSVAQILETKFEHNLEPWLALIEDETLEGKIRTRPPLPDIANQRTGSSVYPGGGAFTS